MKHLRVLLVNVGFRPYENRVYSLPLGVMYLAAYLRERLDVDVRIINQKVYNLPDDEVVRSAVDFGADVVGLSALTSSAHHFPYLTSQIRRAIPQSLIVLGGPHVSSVGSSSLEGTAADAAVPGEGEPALEAVIKHHFEGGGLAGVPGIFRRDRDNEIVVNPGKMPLIEDLDSLPFPAYDLIDLPAYWGFGIQSSQLKRSIRSLLEPRYISIFASRGCPYRCYYCHKIFGKKFRMQSAERIVEEVKYCKNKYGADTIKVLDDIFNLDRDRLFRFCDMVREEHGSIAIHFVNGLRTDILDEAQIDALVSAGTNMCAFSLESGSHRIQKMIGKNLDIERYLENVHRATEAGIMAQGLVMLGFPTETAEEMQKTLDVCRRSSLNIARFYFVVPFPGTELYEATLKTHPVELRALRYDNLDFERKLIINLSNVSDEELLYYKMEADKIYEKSRSRIPHSVGERLLHLRRTIHRVSKRVTKNGRG